MFALCPASFELLLLVALTTTHLLHNFSYFRFRMLTFQRAAYIIWLIEHLFSFGVGGIFAMDRILFSQPSFVTIQGPRVLEYLSRQQDSVTYNVIGFDGTVYLIDYRHAGLKAIDRLLFSGNLDDFAPEFNSPAHVVIEETTHGYLKVELHESNVNEPQYMLWIVVGLEDEMPVYDYLVEHLIPLADGRFALVALYKRPLSNYSSSSSSSSSISSSLRDSSNSSSSVMSVSPISSGLY